MPGLGLLLLINDHFSPEHPRGRTVEAIHTPTSFLATHHDVKNYGVPAHLFCLASETFLRSQFLLARAKEGKLGDLLIFPVWQFPILEDVNSGCRSTLRFIEND